MTLRFYMDEHVPHSITVQLRLRAVDVLTAQEDGRKGVPDEELLERAIALNRILFTQDDDFLAYAQQMQLEQRSFSGLVYAHQLRASIGTYVSDLELLAKAVEPKDVVNTVIFLPL